MISQLFAGMPHKKSVRLSMLVFNGNVQTCSTRQQSNRHKYLHVWQLLSYFPVMGKMVNSDRNMRTNITHNSLFILIIRVQCTVKTANHHYITRTDRTMCVCVWIATKNCIVHATWFRLSNFLGFYYIDAH